MRTSKARFLAALAVLGVTSIAAAQTPEEQLDALMKRAYGTKPQTKLRGVPILPPPAPGPTADQRVEWYGLIGIDGAGPTIKRLEEEADFLVFGAGSATAGALSEKMKALEAQAKTPEVIAAQGGIGGGNKGLGWYCSKVALLGPALTARAEAFDRIANQLTMELGKIEIGRDDSVQQFHSLEKRFRQALADWQTKEDAEWRAQPDNMTLNETVTAVASGLGGSQKTFGAFDAMANAAAEEARKLKTETKRLEQVGDELVRLLELYTRGREELGRDAKGLQIESGADVVRRDKLIADLAASHTPKATTDAWRGILGDPVAKRSKDADQALARIAALTAGSRSEDQSGCGTTKNPAADFRALVDTTKQRTEQICDKVERTLDARLQQFVELDQKHAELIAKNEKTAKDIGKRIVEAEETYDKKPKDSPERQKLYEGIVEARKLGADAAQAAIDLQLQRQGLLKEQEVTKQQSAVILGEFRAAFIVQFGIK